MKKLLTGLLAVVLAFASTGCTGLSGQEKEGQLYLYYVNDELNCIEEVPYESEAETAEELLVDLLAKQTVLPAGDEYLLLLPEEVTILDYKTEDEILTLNFSSSYISMDTSREILVRAGMVRTFVQVPGINWVKFQVDGNPLLDSSGKEIGALRRESFVENSGKEINTYQNATMTLYFTTENGASLVSEERNVYYSSNVPLERAVVEEIVKGPSEEGHYPTLPVETNILSVMIQEGICYVNFDDSFMNAVPNVKDEIPIYSIVNSLAATCRVNKVQFSINGSSSVKFRKQIKLDQLFEQNLELVKTE